MRRWKPRTPEQQDFDRRLREAAELEAMKQEHKAGPNVLSGVFQPSQMQGLTVGVAPPMGPRAVGTGPILSGSILHETVKRHSEEMQRVDEMLQEAVSGWVEEKERADRLARHVAQLEGLVVAQQEEVVRLGRLPAKMLGALELVCEMVDEPPPRHCTCHLHPPCSDCVNYSGLREMFLEVRAAIAEAKGAP